MYLAEPQGDGSTDFIKRTNTDLVAKTSALQGTLGTPSPAPISQPRCLQSVASTVPMLSLPPSSHTVPN